MEIHTWLTYVFAFFLASISPGASAILSMSHGSSFGVKRSASTILGLMIGLSVVLFIAGVGLGSVLLASEFAFISLKVLGALYLIYLGIKQFRSANQTSLALKHQTHYSWSHSLLSGFLTNVSNPKGIIFMVAMLPQFIVSDLPLWPQLLVLTLTTVTIEGFVMLGYASLTSRLSGLLKKPSIMKWQARFFGSVLTVLGLSLLLIKRTSSTSS